MTDSLFDTKHEAVLRRDRLAVLTAVLLLIALAWSYVLWLSLAMPDASMQGMDMRAMAPAIRPWTPTDLLFGVLMWTVMMAGMMLPSVVPVILLYVLVGRQAEALHKPLAATGWFIGGYLLAWVGFSLLAALLQAGLLQAALLTPQLASANDMLGGAILIAAGLYQWSPLKYKCLAKCRAPLFFIQRHGGFKPGAKNAVTLGFRHGLYCVGCCWALMLLLFVGGIMNVAWIAGLAVLVLAEKLWTHGPLLSRAVGIASIAGGLFLIVRDFANW